MRPSEQSILIGLPVTTVAQIADCAGTLKRVARWRPDGRVAGALVSSYGRVVEGTESAFSSEETAVAHLDELVTACVEWCELHEPACQADASFAC